MDFFFSIEGRILTYSFFSYCTLCQALLLLLLGLSLTMAKNTFESREINVTIPKYSEDSCQNSQHLNGVLQLPSRLNYPGSDQ